MTSSLFLSNNMTHKYIVASQCSRIVDAESPMAIVIPTRGSELGMKLRDGDLSWCDFLEGVDSLKYVPWS